LTGWNRPSISPFHRRDGVHQQDHVGRRGRALGLQPRQNSGIIGVHPVDLDAGGLGEVGIQSLVRAVVPGRIQVQDLFLGRCAGAGQHDRGGDENELFEHAGFPWVMREKWAGMQR
jgi:hypothetical protein